MFVLMYGFPKNPLTFSLAHIQSGQFNEDMIPTVGFNMRKVTKGNVTIKVLLLRDAQSLAGKLKVFHLGFVLMLSGIL